jgi:hypothetical protein
MLVLNMLPNLAKFSSPPRGFGYFLQENKLEIYIYSARIFLFLFFRILAKISAEKRSSPISFFSLAKSRQISTCKI